MFADPNHTLFGVSNLVGFFAPVQIMVHENSNLRQDSCWSIQTKSQPLFRLVEGIFKICLHDLYAKIACISIGKGLPVYYAHNAFTDCSCICYCWYHMYRSGDTIVKKHIQGVSVGLGRDHNPEYTSISWCLAHSPGQRWNRIGLVSFVNLH